MPEVVPITVKDGQRTNSAITIT